MPRDLVDLQRWEPDDAAIVAEALRLLDCPERRADAALRQARLDLKLSRRDALRDELAEEQAALGAAHQAIRNEIAARRRARAVVTRPASTVDSSAKTAEAADIQETPAMTAKSNGNAQRREDGAASEDGPGAGSASGSAAPGQGARSKRVAASPASKKAAPARVSSDAETITARLPGLPPQDDETLLDAGIAELAAQLARIRRVRGRAEARLSKIGRTSATKAPSAPGA